MRHAAIIVLGLCTAGCASNNLMDLLPPGTAAWFVPTPQDTPVSVTSMLDKVLAQAPKEDAPSKPTCEPYSLSFQSAQLGLTDLDNLEQFQRMAKDGQWSHVSVIRNKSGSVTDFEGLQTAVQIAKYAEQSFSDVALKAAPLEDAVIRLQAHCPVTGFQGQTMTQSPQGNASKAGA